MTDRQTVDLLLNARWVLPIVPTQKVFEDCSVVVDDGQIVAIVPRATATARFAANTTVELPEHVLMPGFVNAHGHAAMSLLRGFADDLPLAVWLNDHIWPAEGRFVNPDFVRDGTELAVAEMLASGTTCFSDMYFFPEETATVAHRLGMRAQITFPVLDFPTAWAATADEYIHKGLALHDDYRSQNTITIGFGPHAPYTVSDAPLERIGMLADELQTPVQIHLHETAEEVHNSLNQFGHRPIERLAKLGLINPLTQCVHMTALSGSDITLVAERGASVVHCPQSNLKLASGLCPVARLLAAGVAVGLGTDGAASNNGLSMLAELNVAALIGKIAAQDAAAVSAWQALEMATLGSARAIGMEAQIGSIEAGKCADLTALKITGSGAAPIFDIASHLVYNNRNLAVSHTWVNGRCLFDNGEHVNLSLGEVHHKAELWRAKIRS